ncbi:hypothetical protein DERF_013058 [Dermatophagoides farinae]|uniref:PAS domain-containing protein n=1 Tax=Dermatophagoides farinae TaxID=6954 RepID=A0A922HNQ2_DERFA|nr:hypothetical protein DERF_013058 [Dermatophagoides farinae]
MYVNDAINEIIGLNDDDMIGSGSSFFEVVPHLIEFKPKDLGHLRSFEIKFDNSKRHYHHHHHHHRSRCRLFGDDFDDHQQEQNDITLITKWLINIFDQHSNHHYHQDDHDDQFGHKLMEFYSYESSLDVSMAKHQYPSASSSSSWSSTSTNKDTMKMKG